MREGGPFAAADQADEGQVGALALAQSGRRATMSRSSAWLKLMMSTCGLRRQLLHGGLHRVGMLAQRPHPPGPGTPIAAVYPVQGKWQRRQHARQRMAHMAAAKQRHRLQPRRQALAQAGASAASTHSKRRCTTPPQHCPRLGPSLPQQRRARQTWPDARPGVRAPPAWPAAPDGRRLWCPAPARSPNKAIQAPTSRGTEPLRVDSTVTRHAGWSYALQQTIQCRHRGLPSAIFQDCAPTA